jgi:CBS domain containing-hemolysin-like protein
VGQALQEFLKTHQQLFVVVDEFGSTAGVLTIEDVMEHIIGREIFEKDDVAVDMRELARARLKKSNRKGRPDLPDLPPSTGTTHPQSPPS